MPVPLLLLPGALGRLEGSGIVSERLGEDRPVVTIDYRSDDRFEPLLRRILAAADQAGAERFDLLGQSYGGWIAQCVAARHPERVRRLVLSHTFTLERRHARRFRFGPWLLERFPRRLLRPLLTGRVRKALAPVRQLDPALAERQLAAVAAQFDAGTLLPALAAQQHCMRESLEGEEVPRTGACLPVLIIESANDPLIAPSARSALRKRFPQATVHRFTDAGHVSAVVQAERYAALVKDFLDSTDR